jgi:hypothetical protein
MRTKIFFTIGWVLFGLVLGPVAINVNAAGKNSNKAGDVPAPVPPVNLDLGHASVKTVNASFSYADASGTVVFLKGKDRPSVSFSFASLDLSSATGVNVQLKNRGDQSIRVFGSLNNNPWVTDVVAVGPGKTVVLRIFLQRTSFYPTNLGTAFRNMNGIPGGQMKLWPSAEVDASSINELTLYSIRPIDSAMIEIENASTFQFSQPNLGIESLHPFVDRYGQLSYKDWLGKTKSDDALRESKQMEHADLMRHPKPVDFDRFGGWLKGPKLRATADFRVEKYDNRWWFVDPDGRLFWSNGITGVTFQEETDVKHRATYFQDPAANGDFLARNLRIKYGPSWRKEIDQITVKRLRSWGLNTIGPWSDRSLTANARTPYTYLFSSRDADGKIDPHSRTWYLRLRAQIAEKAAVLNRDPWCLGIFIDNEIHDSKDPKWWEDYYRQINGLVRRYLPHKLYLGSRLDFADFPNVDANQLEIARIAARFTDVISFNQYRYTLEDFVLPSGVDRPVLVSEFHFGALDRGLLHTGLRSVVDQNQRAEAYIDYVESGLRNPQVVGVHWFQMYDEPVTGRGDGENYQIGFLDICDQPYPETIEASRFAGNQLYFFRAQGMASGNEQHDSD